MDFMHELVMTVIDNASQAFNEAGMPPAAIGDLKEEWLAKLDARGMFDAGPSPFPPVAIATKELYKLRCAIKKKAHHRSAHEYSTAELGTTDGGATLPRGSRLGASAPATSLRNTAASRREAEEDAEYGRPQRARPPPRTASLPLAASGEFEVLPAAPNLPGAAAASSSERPSGPHGHGVRPHLPRAGGGPL
jgi:hypothetical protein